MHNHQFSKVIEIIKQKKKKNQQTKVYMATSEAQMSFTFDIPSL